MLYFIIHISTRVFRLIAYVRMCAYNMRVFTCVGSNKHTPVAVVAQGKLLLFRLAISVSNSPYGLERLGVTSKVTTSRSLAEAASAAC